MPHLALSSLGALTMTLDGQPLTGLESAKARALLVYLAFEQSRPHSRDALAGLLWADQPNQTARNNLRQTLANLRRVLGDRDSTERPFLLVTRDSVQFNPESDHAFDATQFVTLLASCAEHSHRRAETCRVCASYRQQAVDLYSGDFLDQFFLPDSAPFEEWALVRRENLRRLALGALGSLAEHHMRWRHLDLALPPARRELQLDPWNEEAHRQVMRILALSGQRGAAQAQYETCRRILAKELNAEPSEETTALYAAIKAGANEFSNLSASLSPSSLPAPATGFVGRQAELERLGALLADPACRLITLLGLGGIGKTRLALQAAREASAEFRDGVFFVPLASVNSPEGVAPAIMAALGASLQGPRDPNEQLLTYLQTREVLLVLDTFEHLPAGVDLLTRVLANASRVVLLVTSRERLKLQGEWVFDLPGLEIPEGGQPKEVERYSAVQLFIQTARRGRTDCQFSDEEEAIIVRICRLVEGVPLAIELAAAWTRNFSCQQIAEEIQASFGFLSTSWRDAPARHRSMQAVFEHSWNLLDKEEQSVFSRLSTFRGGFRREAAGDVAGATLSSLAALLDKSLIRTNGAERYDLHELARQFAQEKLIESGGMEQTRDCHLLHFAELAEEAASHLPGPDQQSWLGQLDAENDNLRAALEWSLASARVGAGLRLAGALWRFWYSRGYFQEGRQWLERLLAQAGNASPADKSRALYGAGALALIQGDLEGARAHAAASLTIARQLADLARLAHSARLLGIIAREQGEFAESRAHLRESLAVLEQLGDRQGIAWLLINMGESMRGQGDYAGALSFYSQSSQIAQELGDKEAVATCLLNSGHAARSQGDFVQAASFLRSSLGLSQALGSEHSIAECLAAFGCLAASQDQPERAVRLFAAVERLLDGMGYHLYRIDRADSERALETARAQLDPAAFASAWEQSWELNLEQAVAYASAEEG